MKKILPLFLVLFLLAGCTGAGPNESDAEMATRVAGILTAMPVEATATLPPSPTAPPAVIEITLAPTATETPTALPSETPTTAPTATEVPASATPTAEPGLAGSPTATLETPQVGGGQVVTTPPAGVVVPNTPVPNFTPPASDPRSKLGSPTSTDPMDNNTAWGWPLGASEFTAMDFRDGSMLLTGLTDVSGWRLPMTDAFQNVYIEATFRPSTCAGTDNYGIIFRVPVFSEADRGYMYGVTCDGKYYLKKWDGKVKPDGKGIYLVYFKPSSAIVQGANQTNRLGVMAVDNRLILYVNGVLLGEVKDPDFTTGYFGVFVNPDKTSKFTVRVDEMSYWKNPTP